SKKWIGVLAALAVLAALGVGGWFVYQNMQKSATRSTSAPAQTAAVAPEPPAPVSAPTPPPPAPALGRAMIKTSPTGATIILDNKQLLSPATFPDLKPGKYSMRIELDGYEPIQQEIDIRQNQTSDLGMIALKAKKPAVAMATAPTGPKEELHWLIPNAIYTGIIREKSGGAYGYNVPVSIAPAADSKSGTMTQSAKSGDVVSKYTGVWDGKIFRGVTNEVVSKPARVQWEPESFSLQVSDDGKSARYECNADGKSYAADLTAQTLGSATAAKLSAIYKG